MKNNDNININNLIANNKNLFLEIIKIMNEINELIQKDLIV